MDWLQGRTADHTFTLQGQISDPLESQIARSMHEYHQARQIKLPDAVPASAGGQVKTSTDSTLLLPVLLAHGAGLVYCSTDSS